MSKSIKVLLTIAYGFGLIYVITFFSNDFLRWFTNNVIAYEQQNLLIALITYPTLIYLIYRLWSFKYIETSTKGSWTFLLLFFGIITIPIYVWKTDDTLTYKNGQTTLHNND